MVEELRIGNWIKVDDLPEEQVTLETFATLSRYPNTLVYFKPIPLTVKWLEKFGFERGYDKELPWQNSYKIKGLLLSEDFTMSDFTEYMTTYGKPQKHVHELQNLYHALTGHELTIAT